MGNIFVQRFAIRISSKKTRTRSKMKKRIKKISLRPRNRNGVTDQKQANKQTTDKTNTNDKLPGKDRLKLTFRTPPPPPKKKKKIMYGYWHSLIISVGKKMARQMAKKFCVSLHSYCEADYLLLRGGDGSL